MFFSTPDGLTPSRETDASIRSKEDAQMRIQELQLVEARRDEEAYLTIVVFVDVHAEYPHEWRGMMQSAPRGVISGIAEIGFSVDGVASSVFVEPRGGNHISLIKAWGSLRWAPHEIGTSHGGHYIEWRTVR